MIARLAILLFFFCASAQASTLELVVPSDKNLLFYVNTTGDFGFIDKDTLESTKLADLPSWINNAIACAYDADNERVYIHDRVSPYGISYYDLYQGTFHQAGTAPGLTKSYPMMEFDNSSKLLYVGNATKIFVIDPSTTNTLSIINIDGYSGSTGGGDIAFGSGGTKYITPNSGLYSLDINDSEGTPTRISGESLPFYLTSMAIDDDDIVWLATNDQGSQLMNMDTVTGAYTVRKVFDHKINDLTDRPKDAAAVPTDTDGDGVNDEEDDFPDDAESSGAVYTPSQLGTGTFAFEDNWPNQGDYDFNDLVINYRYTKFINTSNETIKMEMKFAITAIGASFRNGFGVELPISKDLVESVEGVNISRGWVTLESTNLEAGHEKAVIIVFDNAFDNMGAPLQSMTRTKANQAEAPIKEITINIRFNDYIDASLLDGAPYNPFIFVNKTRGREVHLPGKLPTDLANTSLLYTGDDRTILGNEYTYKNSTGLPWAISLPHKFRVPEESIPVNEAYNDFINFATSETNDYTSWYSDAPGNRNTNKMFFPEDDTSLFTD